MSGSTTFNYTGKIVTWTVPTTGAYEIDAIGGSGGEYHAPFQLGVLGGYPADVSGVFSLSAGETLSIAVAGAGAMGPGDEDNPGAGGGGAEASWLGRAGHW
jgi:hypothetical protein